MRSEIHYLHKLALFPHMRVSSIHIVIARKGAWKDVTRDLSMYYLLQSSYLQ